jgi:predicted enzyme related to lactoylglutathione lyase
MQETKVPESPRAVLLVLAMVLLFGSWPGEGRAQETPIFPSITASPTGQHEPGKFVWYDLVTKDVETAKRFYGELFGWEYRSDPANDFFTVIVLAGRPIAGIILEDRVSDESGVARWYSSVSVVSVDKTVKTARDREATISIPPTDLPERGRYSVLRDPQGAALVLLRAAGGDPTDPAEFTAGSFLWTELWTRDAPAAVSFYEAVLGYTAEFRGDEVRRYFVLSRGGEARAGLGQLPLVDADPLWLPYVAVRDVQTIVARVPDLGGEVLVRPEATQRGSAAVIADPSGGVIAVQQWPMPASNEGEEEEER